MQDWEALATDFPLDLAGVTLKWIPKGLTRRYAAARLRILTLCMQAETHQPRLPPDRIYAWSRLASLMPYLLLHDTTRNRPPVHPPTTTRQTLTHRLYLAEQCDYSTLLNQALEYHDESLDKQRAGPLHRRSRYDILVAAAERAEDGCTKSASRLLRGDAVLPSTADTVDAVEALYRTGPPTPLQIPPARNGAVTAVQARYIMNRLRKIRGTAHPGPSGERNTHLQALRSSPACTSTLTQWVNTWLRPDLSISFRQPWLTCGLVPLDKGEGKPRPIVFQESLLKLATGSTVDANAQTLRKAAGSWQKGVYDEGGAIDLVWELRDAMSAYPNDVFTTVDCRNAFGEAHRAPALRTADQHAPAFSRLLRNLWHGTDTIIFVPDGQGSTREVHVTDGFVQGGCEAAPGFALCLREAIDRFAAEADRLGARYCLWAYMDDIYLQCAPEKWESLMTILSSCLAAAGLTCRPDKSHCHIPALTPEQTTQAAPHYRHHALLHPDGLPALGTAADGQFQITLRPQLQKDPKPPTETEERLANAIALADHLSELCSTPQSGVRFHPAWRILTCVINQALSYDASVNGPGTTVPYGRRLDDLVLNTATRLINEPNPAPTTIQQLRLSRAEGGCGLRAATDRCYTAFLSTVLRLRRFGSDRSEWLTQQTTLAIEGLRSLDICLDSNAMPHPTATPPPNPFQPDRPHPALRKRQRTWWMAIDKHRASELSNQHPDTAKRIQSCSGPEGGAFLVATRADGVKSLTDFLFITAVRYRLGLPVMPACACQHTTAAKGGSPGKKCNALADPQGHHACLCKVGGAPYAAHGQGCHILFEASTTAGFQSRREQIVPELARPDLLSPQLDVEGWGVMGQERLLIDFTIRHPFANRYATTTTSTPTNIAAGEKAGHYGTTQTLHIRTAALEVYGRHGDGMTQLLEYLADLARQRERALGQAPSRWLKRWRAQLSNVAAHLVGRAVQQACPAIASTPYGAR